MKTIVRILVILAASLLVVGVTVALGQNSSTTQLPLRSEEFRSQEGNTSGTDGVNSPQRIRPEGGRDGRRDFEGGRRAGGFNAFGILGFSQTLVPMTIVILLVTAISRLGKPRKKVREAAAVTR